MRIAVVWPYFPPEMGAGSNRGVSLASVLDAAGHQITLCAPVPSYLVLGGKPPPAPHAVDVRIPVRLRSTGGSRMLRVLREVMGALAVPRAIWAAIRRSDVVIISSPPLLFGLAGVFTSRLARRPVVFDIRDLWPDVVLESGEVADSFLSRSARRIAHAGYKAADLISVVSRGSRAKLIALGIAPDKIVLAPNGVEAALVDPDDRDDAIGAVEVHELAELTRSRRRAQFRIVYSGLLGPAQGVGLLLDALRDTGLPIRVDLVGDGSQADALRRASEGANFEVRFHGLLPRHEALMIAASADAAFVPLVDAAMADTIPSKLFESMAIGLPILAVTSGEAAEIVTEAGGGLVSAPRDVGALASNVVALASGPDEARAMGDSGRSYVRDHYLRERIFERLTGDIERIARSAERRST